MEIEEAARRETSAEPITALKSRRLPPLTGEEQVELLVQYGLDPGEALAVA